MLRKITITLAIILGTLFLLTSGTVAVLYFTHAGEYTVAATTDNDPVLPHLELEGYRFHSESYGDIDDPVVIALHGGPGGDYRSILPLKALADDGYRVVFYDQRGSGLSPRVNEKELNLQRFIADLDLFVEYFSPEEPVVLIGHSWGAMLASAYIGEHPEKVKQMVLAEPGMLDDEHMQMFYRTTGLNDMKPTRKIIAALIKAWSESLHVQGPDDQARQDYLLSAFYTAPMKSNPLAGYYKDGKMENAAGEYWRFGSSASTAIPASGIDEDGRLINLAAGGPGWEGRTLFLSGSENTIIGPDYQRTQMHYFPGSTSVVIQGAGHTMIGEKPAESLKAIRSFLQD